MTEAWELVANPSYYASMMVEVGDADGMISGLSFHYPEGLRPPLQIIDTTDARGCKPGSRVFISSRTLNSLPRSPS